MSVELYENLKEMYKSFNSEQEAIKKRLNNCINDNEYQLYKCKLITLESRVKTIGDVIHIFDNYFQSEENGCLSRTDCSFVCYDNYESNINYINKKADLLNRPLQVLDIQEKERQRIARDLHDTSLQNLTHLFHKIELSSMYIDEDPIKTKLDLAVINKNLKAVIQEIRNTIFDLRPMTFDDLGLKESFERLIDRMRESSRLKIEYTIEELYCNNSLILMTIFRIVEECVNNAIKHSGGDRVFFELKKDKKNRCIVIVSDNGKSFNTKEVLSVQDRHFGLCILRERVELLSGTIDIDSKPESGTTVKIIIPLQDYQDKGGIEYNDNKSNDYR